MECSPSSVKRDTQSTVGGISQRENEEYLLHCGRRKEKHACDCIYTFVGLVVGNRGVPYWMLPFSVTENMRMEI